MEVWILARFFSWNLSNFEKLLKFAKTCIFWQKSSDFALICFQSSSNLQNYQISLEIFFKKKLYIVYIQEKKWIFEIWSIFEKNAPLKKKIYIYIGKNKKYQRTRTKTIISTVKTWNFDIFFKRISTPKNYIHNAKIKTHNWKKKR